MQTPKIPSLDGLRGYSILLVISGHFLLHKQGHTRLFDATLGVNIFFVISGFLITTLLLKEKISKGNISLLRFYIRRGLRILPIAYLYILIVSILNETLVLGISGNSLLAASLYFKNLLPPSDWYLGHYWSLSVEEQFYFLFPLLLTMGIALYRFVSIIILVSIPLLTYIAFHNTGADLFFFLYGILGRGTGSILIGSLTAIFWFKNAFVLTTTFPSWLIKAACVMLIYISHQLFLIAGLNSMISAIFIAYFLLLNIFYTDDIFSRILNSKLLVEIGVLSYSLYIWQQIFTIRLSNLYSNNLLDNVIFNIICLFIIAYISYSAVESPILKFKNKYSRS